MKISNRQQGQTLIETALVLFLLLLILLGIAEFSRAWFIKNSLKNAARTGARVAAVESGITNADSAGRTSPEAAGSGLTPADCVGLAGNDKVFCSIWASPGIYTDSDASIPRPTATLTISGNTVTVSTTTGFKSVAPRFPGLAIPSQFSASASMRYEG